MHDMHPYFISLHSISAALQ